MVNTKISDVVDHSKNLYPRWGWFLALGVVLIMLGMGALTYAVMATLTSVIVIGVLMFIGGVAQLIHAWTLRSLGGFFWWTLVGLLYIVAGGMVIQNPIAGAEILTLLLGATLIGVGVLRLGIWLMNRGQEGWLWLAFSGVISLVTGLLIALQWPSIGLWLLGMILGIDLLFQGWSMLWLGIALRRMHRLMQ
ncbi:MAG TPA: HdeD family acid-resistance protein [Paenalcaligenes hominis]|uniref:HdeD family acid-resistance protein n=1 Tax=Paenalcaligenes hominis TaxID=643674 RepID=A0A9D2VGI4_9BURK|nr:HdeD family acid-resistance protein [Paenalcaligenes hominis]